jgi:flagellar M-ring protein FliF
VPGVTANTPPPQAALVDGPPQPAAPAPGAGAGPTDTETATERSYELGREVAVTTARPGGLKKLSVAVAISDAALKKAAPMTAAQLEALVSAAVGANVQRGDQIEVVASKFEPADLAPPAFYEQPWFAMLVRYGAMLLAVLLVLLLAVRPLIAKLKGKSDPALAATDAALADAEAEIGGTAIARDTNGASLGDLPHQVDLARRLATSQPERAVEALQRMLLEGPDNHVSGARAS